MFELIELLGRVFEGALGVRFVFSSSYRARTRARWKNSSWVVVIIECVGAIIGAALLLLMAVFVVHIF